MFQVMRLTLAFVFVSANFSLAAAEPKTVELRSQLLVTGLKVAECEETIYGIRLAAKLDKNGEGSGTLEFDPNAPEYDEFGFLTSTGNLPPVKLECTFKLVKRKTLQIPESGRIAAPLVQVDYVLVQIQGSMITSRLFLTSEEKELSRWGRLLIQDKTAKVRYSIPLTAPLPPEPCHPGCFPAGTQIQSPTGTKAVDSLRAGDVVTTVNAEGASGQEIVASVFVTMNRLIEVQTEESTLTTTETQPLASDDGRLRAAGELKSGDRIYMWDGHERRAVVVRSVIPTGRDARVFNLILGEPVLFIANGFLARSKPPAHANDSTRP